jgi:tetratricopeptide (TPR) repeat protein
MTPDGQETDQEEHGGPRLIVPLSLSEREVDLAVDKLLASGVHTPDDLLDRAAITRRDAYYVPVYVFEGSYEAAWTASFGYDRTEYYTDYQSRTENGLTRKVPVTRQRVVTDWHPAHGNDIGDFTVTAYAGARLASKAIELVESSVAFGKTQAYHRSLTSGLHVEAPLSENDVYTRRAQAMVNAHIERSVKAHGQGSSQSDWHWTARIAEQTATHALLPIYHVVYEYEGKTYNVWFDGADRLRRPVADPLPQDQRRKRHVNLGYVPAAAASVQLFFAGLMSEPSGPFMAVSWSTAGIVAAAWTFSAVRALLIQSDSHVLRQARLAQRTAMRGARPAAPGRNRRTWPTNRFVDGALVVLATVLFWTMQSHVVDTEREAKQTAARQAAQAQAEKAEQETLARAAAQVEDFIDHDTYQGTSINPMLVAAARNGWKDVDALARNAVAPAPVSPARHQAALDANAAGLAALKKDNDAAAIAAFARAVKEDPGNAQAHAYLAAVYLKAGKLGRAQDTVVHALRTAPDNALAWFVQSTLWCGGRPILARQGLRLVLHFSADRKQAMADLQALKDDYARRAVRRPRDLVGEVIDAADAVP